MIKKLRNWYREINNRVSFEEDSKVNSDLQRMINDEEFSRKRDDYFAARPEETVNRYYFDVGPDAREKIQSHLEVEQRIMFSKLTAYDINFGGQNRVDRNIVNQRLRENYERRIAA